MEEETKLKTLKDIEPLMYDADKERFYVKIEALKQEAIKWVKESVYVREKYDVDTSWAEVQWMKFFNITEDELK